MRCVIIAGSPECNTDFITSTVNNDDFVICADKGYLYARNAGIYPDVVVGDFDSFDGKISVDCEIVPLNPHKDDTDTMHSIDIALSRGYKDFLILCGIGGRFDHTFSNVSALQYISEKGGKGLLLSDKEMIEYLPVGEYLFSGYNNKTFSLFPFGCDNVCVSYEGAEYPLDNYCLRSSVSMGVSNEFLSDEAKIKIHKGNAILIINLSKV